MNSAPHTGPSGSNSPLPEGGLAGERGLGYEDRDVAAASNGSRKRGREPLPTVEILTSSRRRYAILYTYSSHMRRRLMFILLSIRLALLIVVSTRCDRPAHTNTSVSDADPDMKEARRSALGASSSSSAHNDDEEDEEEVKEEVGSQDVDEEEIEVESTHNGTGAARGGARTAGGFGGKKKPRKQRRI